MSAQGVMRPKLICVRFVWEKRAVKQFLPAMNRDGHRRLARRGES